MGTITEPEKPIKSGLYSPIQLFITATFGGPAIAGFIIACNLWAREKKSLAIIPVIPGLALGLAIVLLIDSIAHYWGSNYPHFMPSPVLRHIVVFSLYFLLLTISAIPLRFIFRRDTKIKAFIFLILMLTFFITERFIR